jgi:serpin B
MRHMVRAKVLFLVLTISGLHASNENAAAEPAARPTSLASDQATVTAGNNAFAVGLLGNLAGRQGNFFFSPASISTALAMTYAGARGETATEMAQTLHFTLPQDRLHPAMAGLLDDLKASGTKGFYQLSVANALWLQTGCTLRPQFVKLTSDNYGAGLNKVNFGASEPARQTINRWIEQHTANKISNLIGPGVLTSQTRLVLTNAIYFKGHWETQFDKNATQEEDFHVTLTQSVRAKMMQRTGSFGYVDRGALQLLEIPYYREELSMILFLPKSVDGLPRLEQSMTPTNMEDLLSRLRPVSEVIVSLPRFKVTSQYDLNEPLGQMGMQMAFDPARADFSGMTGNRDFSLSDVVHKAFVDVNEEGTEAAAATGVVSRHMALGPSSQPPIFRADHPYLFLIRDKRSGGILFMGRVADPTS